MTVGWAHESKLYMREEVVTGVRFLDKYFEGDSWWERIALTNLDMSSPTDCVLGQLFGGYGHGLTMLHLLHGDASEEHGFTVIQPALLEEPQFIALTLTWRLILSQHAEKRN